MSNRPWMPLYIGDYRQDTSHLSTLEHGAYLLLLMHYWANDSLPTDEQKLARIAGLSQAKWKQIRDTIAEFFDSEWRSKRLEAELAKAKDISSKRKTSGKQGGSKRKAKAKQLLPQSPSPSNTYSHTPRKKIDPNWMPSAESIQFAELKGIRDVSAEADQYRNHCQANGTLAEDFDAGFRKWCGNAIAEKQRYARAGPARNGRRTIADAVADRMKEMEHEQANTGDNRGDVEFLPPGGGKSGPVAALIRNVAERNGR